MIVQGSKRVVLGDTTYLYNESLFLLTAVNLPTIEQTTSHDQTNPHRCSSSEQ